MELECRSSARLLLVSLKIQQIIWMLINRDSGLLTRTLRFQLRRCVAFAAIGYASISYLMTAIPLQVVNVAQLGTLANATIIQWHVVAMFAPSFSTGNLI